MPTGRRSKRARARAPRNRAAGSREVFDDARRRLAARAWRRCRRCCAAWWARPSAGSRRPIYPAPAELYELAEDPARRRATACSSCPACAARNPLGAPDVMRGEETQLLGAQCMLDASIEGRQAARLHARHPHQVGVAARRRGAGIPDRAHRRAVRDALRAQRAGARQGHAHRTSRQRISSAASRSRRSIRKCTLLHRLFQSRSLRLDKQLSAEGAASWMSGLLIGTDVGGALSLFPRARCHARTGLRHRRAAAHRILFAGARAPRAQGRAASKATQAALAGLGYVYRELERRTNEPA